MTRAFGHRLRRLHATLEASPVQPHLVREAYPRFRHDGELPDEVLVAAAVVQQALNGGLPLRSGQASLPVEATVRSRLFEEALSESDGTRALARAAIEVEVAHGGNVESAAFAARHGMPAHVAVGAHVLGYPQKWALPPYEAQADRLFVRMDEVRRRMGRYSSALAQQIVDHVVAFRSSGTLPADDVQCAAVLAFVELDALIAHKNGQDVGEAMVQFDAAARASDDPERQGALQALGEMARAGRLPIPVPPETAGSH